MTRVALLNSNLTPADAVSNDILGMRRVLIQAGHDVRIFVARVAPGLSEPHVESVNHLDAFLDASAILLYHFSAGWDEGYRIFQDARCRRVLKYHNITPAEYYTAYSPAYALSCRLGQLECRGMSQFEADLYLADSSFNLRDLLDGGIDPSRGLVVPPFHQVDRLREAAPIAKLATACRDGCINLLMVGRIVPNKGYEDLIDAFAFYHHGYNPRSRLILVGKVDPRLSAYRDELLGQAHDLALEDAVCFTGPATDAELRTFYEAADVFLLASRHEGFCVPLLEAMALGVPIVAARTSAVPETLGNAALLWDEPDPELLAESVHTVVSDGAVSMSLRQLGRHRYRTHFRNECIAASLLQALGRVL